MLRPLQSLVRQLSTQPQYHAAMPLCRRRLQSLAQGWPQAPTQDAAVFPTGHRTTHPGWLERLAHIGRRRSDTARAAPGKNGRRGASTSAPRSSAVSATQLGIRRATRLQRLPAHLQAVPYHLRPQPLAGTAARLSPKNPRLKRGALQQDLCPSPCDFWAAAAQEPAPLLRLLFAGDPRDQLPHCRGVLRLAKMAITWSQLLPQGKLGQQQHGPQANL
mmetsp:Transcript_15431/g.36427  ORF Transcript_15431/g.36427 Transcript_15431/m.36427 type:complete len:218 (+) Transcript_15431:224-877(+)